LATAIKKRPKDKNLRDAEKSIVKIKSLKHRISISEQQTSGRSFRAFFFRPDYTVGLGISPNHASAEWHPLAGCTAGRELHPALKNQIFGFAGQSLYYSA